jgi:hypothetical protein
MYKYENQKPCIGFWDLDTQWIKIVKRIIYITIINSKTISLARDIFAKGDLLCYSTCGLLCCLIDYIQCLERIS